MIVFFNDIQVIVNTKNAKHWKKYLRRMKRVWRKVNEFE